MLQKDRGLMERIKHFAEEYALSNHGNTPTMAEIGEKFNISRSGAFGYLKAMNKMGMIRYEDGMIHTDVIDKVAMPLRLCKGYVEGITAGAPNEVEGYVDSYFPIPPMFLDGRKGNFFTLKVTGDSMIDAGIDSGDIVICRESEEARVDDIVVAYIRGAGSTLKRFCQDDDGPFLWAENNSWSIDDRMFGRQFDVQGVAIKVLKDI